MPSQPQPIFYHSDSPFRVGQTVKVPVDIHHEREAVVVSAEHQPPNHAWLRLPKDLNLSSWVYRIRLGKEPGPDSEILTVDAGRLLDWNPDHLAKLTRSDAVQNVLNTDPPAVTRM